MNRKIAFYMTGNYARVLRHCAGKMTDFDCIAFCPNQKAHRTCEKSDSISSSHYLYEKFNEIFSQVRSDELQKIAPDINQSRVLAVDKNHYKRRTSKYQLKVLNTMGIIFAEWLKSETPEFVVFPIIESIDAMLMYELAITHGCKPLVHAHGRNIKKAFFSHSYLETIPSIAADQKDMSKFRIEAERILTEFRRDKGILNYDYHGDHGALCDDEEEQHVVTRFVRNCGLKIGRERHNQTLQLITKFKVFIERVRVPILRFRYLIVERLLLDAEPKPGVQFEFFPLHFSPESSINVPAPFYIDQERVVDNILLTRTSNLPLYLKEHPAMFGTRPMRFYRQIMKKPFVRFLSSHVSGSEIIQDAAVTYSVTGTACLEAFLLGRQWAQIGQNFLSDWVDRRRQAGQEVDPISFIADILAISDDFLIISPNQKAKNYQFVMSKKNITAMVRNLKFHIDHYDQCI